MNLLAQKHSNIWLKSFVISLVIHALMGILGYVIYEKSEVLSKKNEPKKVQLSFKRGGDSAIKDSKYKENTSIPSSKTRELQKMAQDSQNVQDSHQTPQILQMPLNAQNSNQISKQNSRKSNGTKNADLGKDSPQNTLNLSNLQIYDNVNINPNIREMKYKQALNYIATRPIPSDQKAEIIDLYGDELGDYGLAEIDFLVNNLRDIGRITQYHINRRGYPREAALLGQSGKNVIEFYLHPNGDISELRVVASSNSIILDNDMQTNIKVAFREYPRPTTKVKIRFFMTYTHTINPNDYR